MKLLRTMVILKATTLTVFPLLHTMYVGGYAMNYVKGYLKSFCIFWPKEFTKNNVFFTQ